MLDPHFIALLTFVTEENGGRSTPVSSGYRPLIKFPFYTGLFTGRQNFTGTDLVFPGDTVSAEITLLNTEHFKGKIYEGLDFDFYEGPVLIGSGLVTKILNPDLK